MCINILHLQKMIYGVQSMYTQTLLFPKKGMALEQLLGDNLWALTISCLIRAYVGYAREIIYAINAIYGKHLFLLARGPGMHCINLTSVAAKPSHTVTPWLCDSLSIKSLDIKAQVSFPDLLHMCCYKMVLAEFSAVYMTPLEAHI